MIARTLIATALAALSIGAAAAQDAPTLGLAESETYGSYVTGPQGLPVYVFETDEIAGDNQPAIDSCNADCRTDWPWVTLGSGDITVADELDPDLATSILRDGARIAVYNSEVLFGFTRDEIGAEPQGHSISTYGGWWYLIGPDGVALPRD